MHFNEFHYVVVEGPIGVGKTSLATRLAEHLDADTLLEKPDENPFLAKFYHDPSRYALATQLFFLLQRGNEVPNLAQMDLFSQSTISDYLFDKDLLFARLNLNDEEFLLYQQIYKTLQLQAPDPDLVIYLQANSETLVDRVQRRAKYYESGISDDYLQRLSKSYSDFFYHYDSAPVLIVNNENLNFVDGDADFNLLLNSIEEMRGPREFLSMGAV